MSMENHVALLLVRAQDQLAHGDPSGAIETLRLALSTSPDDAAAHALLALALVQARRRHAARVEASMALALEPEAPFPHLALGSVHRAHGDLEAAEEEYRRFVELAPDAPAGHRALADVLRARGRTAEAREALERALALDAADPETLAARAALALATGDLGEAERWARAALAEDAQNEDALVALGGALLRRGQVDLARELAVAALQEDATSTGALHLLAQVKARQSWLLGLWWRWGTFFERFGPARQILILMLLYVLYRFAVITLRGAGMTEAAQLAQWGWLAFAAYTWFSPALFRRSLEKELQKVRLRPGF
jgi:Flp pilus assembly protein TadD